MLAVTNLDHIVLNVGDVDKSLHFYCEVLGLAADRVEEYRDGKIRFPSVRVNERPRSSISFHRSSRRGINHEGLAENLNHLCLVWEGEDVQAVTTYLEQFGIEPLRPPSNAWGARGRGTSIRILDPDNNLVELRTYETLDSGGNPAQG